MNDPKMTKLMKYIGAPALPQHVPRAQSGSESQSESIMQSYMIAFHASPVTILSKTRSEFPKLVKLASLFSSP